MKIGGRRNSGWGRSMRFAIRSLLRDKYGEGRFGTRRSHEQRLNDFIDFLHAQGVRDLGSIQVSHVETYALRLRDDVETGRLRTATATNRLSSANVLLRLLNDGAVTKVSARRTIGQRTYVRVHEPIGLSTVDVRRAIQGLTERGDVRLALVLALARFAGARFREASLLEVEKARQQALKDGRILIRRGSKGGRSRKLPREIPASEDLLSALSQITPKIVESNLIPARMNYIQWYRGAHREWRKYCGEFGLSSRFHELRAAYACQRYEELTGRPAPCVKTAGIADPARALCSPISDAEAREQIALELGHGRAQVVAAYIGAVR